MSCGSSIVISTTDSSGNTRTIEITSSDGSIDIVKQVLADKDIYDLTIATVYDLVGAMTIDPTAVQLQGNSVEVTLDWTWTKNSAPTTVTSQEYNDGIAGFVSILASLRQQVISGVIGSRTFQVRGTDGTSTITLSKSITFSNYIYRGELADDLDGTGESNIVTNIKTLSKLLQSDVETSFTGTGTAGDEKYYYFAFPSSMDPNNYFEDATKTTQAGFFQLGDTIRSGFFLIGEYNITNDASTPYTESYKIYQSASNRLNNITYNVKQV